METPSLGHVPPRLPAIYHTGTSITLSDCVPLVLMLYILIYSVTLDTCYIPQERTFPSNDM